MAIFVVLRHPVNILVTDFTNPDNLTTDLLMLNSLIKKQIFGQQMMQLDKKSFILTTLEPSVNRVNLQAPTLEGPPRANPGTGPLTVLYLDN